MPILTVLLLSQYFKTYKHLNLRTTKSHNSFLRDTLAFFTVLNSKQSYSLKYVSNDNNLNINISKESILFHKIVV